MRSSTTAVTFSLPPWMPRMVPYDQAGKGDIRPVFAVYSVMREARFSDEKKLPDTWLPPAAVKTVIAIHASSVKSNTE